MMVMTIRNPAVTFIFSDSSQIVFRGGIVKAEDIKTCTRFINQ